MPETLGPDKECTRETSRFVTIRLSSIRSGAVADFCIYTLPEGQPYPVPCCDMNRPFPDDVREGLTARGIQYVFIGSEHEDQYRHYLERNLSDVLSDSSVAVGERSEILYYSAASIMEELISNPHSNEVASRSRILVENICYFLLSEKSALRHLLIATSRKYYVYTHCVNVSLLSIALAQRVGIECPEELCQLGKGAILHDLGKSLIDPEILDRPGKLDDAQWNEIRKHPALGHETLRAHGVTSPLALGVVRHHHEKLRGIGYPDGLVNGEISPHARICAIADVFDALTTKRAYSRALKTFTALRRMCREMSKDLDKDFLRAFVGMMGHPEAV